MLSEQEIKKAEEIRRQEIFWNNQFVGMCNTHLAIDARYNLRAYEIMTPEKILMSEKRNYKMLLEENVKFLKDYDEFEKASRNSKIICYSRIA